MNKYELAVVVTTKIEDEERTATIDKVKAYVERFGGQITNVDEWGKRKLAYPINYETEALYYVVKFTAAPEFPAELDRVMNITDGVLRSMITVVEE